MPGFAPFGFRPTFAERKPHTRPADDSGSVASTGEAVIATRSKTHACYAWRRDNPDEIGFIFGLRLHSPATRPGVTKGRILIVDDDESTRRFLAALLTALGHEGACAQSGEEALRRLRE